MSLPFCLSFPQLCHPEQSEGSALVLALPSVIPPGIRFDHNWVPHPRRVVVFPTRVGRTNVSQSLPLPSWLSFPQLCHHEQSEGPLLPLTLLFPPSPCPGIDSQSEIFRRNDGIASPIAHIGLKSSNPRNTSRGRGCWSQGEINVKVDAPSPNTSLASNHTQPPQV